MKKILCLILALLLLTGCSATETTAPHTHEDLTIRIPVDYLDLSDEEYSEGLTFVYGLDPIAVNGLREEKSVFQSYGLDLNAQTYGQLLLKANNVPGELEQKDGIWTFSYRSGDYAYVVTLWETQEALWTVQAYCPAAQLNKCEKEMWQILSSVTVN